jgi:hypothetical protein
LCAFLSIIGCSEDKQSTATPAATAAPLEEIVISLLFSPETEDFARGASDAFNRVKNSLADGAVVKLNPISATISDARMFLEERPTEPFLWLAPSTLEADQAKEEFESRGGKQGSCESLFLTAPTFAYRTLDSFAFDSSETPTDLSLFLEQESGSKVTQPVLVTGHPLLSPSGPTALAMSASAVSGLPYSNLRADTFETHSDTFKRLSAKLVHQFGSDQTMLEWLASREGGAPILALTTQQQLRSFSKRSPAAQLSEVVAPLSPFDLDYPLCVVETPQALSRSQQATRLARGFLSSAHVAPLIEAAGFSTKRPGRPASEQISRTSLEGLVRSRSSLGLESWTSLVFDTSIAVERSLLDSTRNLVSRHLLQATPPLPFATSIMSCSTTPEVLVRSTRGPNVVLEALQKLRSSGGFAFGDCALRALDAAADPELQATRKTVVVLTRGLETSNVTALNELKQLVPRRLNRTQTVLYVVSIAHKPGENAAFESHARSLGAVVVPTTPRTLPATLTTLLAELS